MYKISASTRCQIVFTISFVAESTSQGVHQATQTAKSHTNLHFRPHAALTLHRFVQNFTVSIFQIHSKCTGSNTLVPYRIERSKIRDFLATRRWSRCTGSQKRHVLGHFHSADRPGRLHLRYVLNVARRKIPRFSIDTRHNTNRFRKFESHRDREGRFG